MRGRTCRCFPARSSRRSRAFEEDEVLRRRSAKEFSDYYATSRAWELKAWQRDGDGLGAGALRAIRVASIRLASPSSIAIASRPTRRRSPS